MAVDQPITSVEFPAQDSRPDPFRDSFSDPGLSTRVNPRTIGSGNQMGETTQGGTSNVRVSSSESVIVVSDSDNDRILIGYQGGGF